MAGAKIYEEREPKRRNKLSQHSTAALIKGLKSRIKKTEGDEKKSCEKLSYSRRSLDAGHKSLKNMFLLDEKFPDTVLRKWNGRL